MVSRPICVTSLTADGYHIRRQSIAMTRQRIDQFDAMRLVVQQQHGIGAAGVAIGRQATCAACASARRPAAMRSSQRRSDRRPRIVRSRRRSCGSIAT